MARKRMLSPEMFTSETIAGLPIPTRWTWAGMLTYLDDFGRGRDNAALVKATVWPLDDSYTSRKVAADLDLLVEVGSLCRYSCCGNTYVHSPTWSQYQRVSHPTRSKMCPCPLHDEEPHANSSGAAPESPREIPPSVVKSSSDQIRGSAGEKDAEPVPTILPERFDEFWQSYPKRVAKGQAVKAWKAAIRKTDPDVILSAVAVFARAQADKDPAYIAHPSTWLNAERWADELQPAASSRGSWDV